MVLQETRIRLSKAVLLKDALTGAPVSEGVRIRSLSGGRMEKKGQGSFLFLDVDSPEFEIEMESPVYQSRKLCLKSDCGENVQEILLYPSAAYPWRAGYTAVRGRAKPQSVLWFHVEDERKCCRLIGDYKKGEEEILFYVKNGISSVYWHIGKKQRKTGEYFYAGKKEDTETYILEKPLKTAYQKKDTVVYPAQETMANEAGEFYILFKNLPQEVCKLYYSYENEKGRAVGEAEILCEKENSIIL